MPIAVGIDAMAAKRGMFRYWIAARKSEILAESGEAPHMVLGEATSTASSPPATRRRSSRAFLAAPGVEGAHEKSDIEERIGYFRRNRLGRDLGSSPRSVIIRIHPSRVATKSSRSEVV